MGVQRKILGWKQKLNVFALSTDTQPGLRGVITSLRACYFKWKFTLKNSHGI